MSIKDNDVEKLLWGLLIIGGGIPFSRCFSVFLRNVGNELKTAEKSVGVFLKSTQNVESVEINLGECVFLM